VVSMVVDWGWGGGGGGASMGLEGDLDEPGWCWVRGWI